ncbi:MAG: hypothetical protein INQ03_10525 [Candidatus Heimdallarchaeota archaeon]|nr:hypothetical protein [Candidatus Heimdallarchaeota archaeon]
MDEFDDQAFDLKDVISFLQSHELFDLQNNPLFFSNSLEFQIMDQINKSTSVTLDELLGLIDLKSLVSDRIELMKEYNFVNMEGERISLNTEYLNAQVRQSKKELDLFEDLLPSKSKRKIVKPTLDFDASEPEDESLSPRQRLFERLSKASQANEDAEEEDDLFGDLGDEPLSNILGDITEGDTTFKVSIITPLIDLLSPAGYTDGIRDSEYEQLPAYQVLKTILKQYPISTEEIEKQIEIEASLSMLLSNLQADNIIAQTNDYRWSFSKPSFKKLKEFVTANKSVKVEDPDIRLIQSHIQGGDQQFIEALAELNYINKQSDELCDYLDKAEVELLNIIRLNPGKSTEELKELGENIMPVVVMRMISKLVADGVIEDIDGTWSISNKLKFLMVKSVLKDEIDDDRFESIRLKFE